MIPLDLIILILFGLNWSVRKLLISTVLSALSEEYPEYNLCVLEDFNHPCCQWSNDNGLSMAVPVAGVSPREVEPMQILSFSPFILNQLEILTIISWIWFLCETMRLRYLEKRKPYFLRIFTIHHPPLSFEFKYKSVSGCAINICKDDILFPILLQCFYLIL